MAQLNEPVFKKKIETKKLFVKHNFAWWLLGQKPKKNSTKLFYVYSCFFNIFFPIGFPLHLIIGLFRLNSAADIFDNLAGTFTSSLGTLKSYVIWFNFDKIKEMEKIMSKLEERIINAEDLNYYQHKVYSAARNIANLFTFFCFGAAISYELGVIILSLLDHWQLIYPAYFPFDPFSSQLKYTVAHLYHCIGVSSHILANFVNDTYGGMCMALIAGHTRLLGHRVSRIGWDKTKTQAENNTELVKCIEEHKILLLFHSKLISIVSAPLLFQLILYAVNMCIVIIKLMFFIEDAFSFIYYLFYLLALPLEIFPSCYYASKMEIEFENLTYAIFKCNWMDQNNAFKRNLRIFSEFSLRLVSVEAGGIVRVDLPAFIASCRLAYSLYTVVSELK